MINKKNVQTIILLIAVIAILSSCENNNPQSDALPTEVILQQPSISSVVIEEPVPDYTQVVLDSELYKITSFLPPVNENIEVITSKGCIEGKIIYTINDETLSVKLYGFMNDDFTKLTEAIYDGVNPFNKGCAIVKDINGYGVIDINGKVLIECQYTVRPVIYDEIISISVESRNGYRESLDFEKSSGELKYRQTSEFKTKSETYVTHRIYPDGNREQIYTLEDWGDVSIRPVMDNTTELWGYINVLRETVIEYKYNEAYEFSEGIAKVKVGDYYGFIDEYGENIIEYVYSEASEFKDDRVKVREDEQYFYIDRDGNNINSEQYIEAEDFQNGMAAVSVNGIYWGYIDKKGNWVLEDIYIKAGNFTNDHAAVKEIIKKEEIGPEEYNVKYFININGDRVFGDLMFDWTSKITADGFILAHSMKEAGSIIYYSIIFK